MQAGAPAPTAGPVAEPDPARIVVLLRADDLDAALDAGLMSLSADAAEALDPDDRALVTAARDRRRAAWDARDRYRARTVRLARRAAEREARRRPAPPATTAAATAPPLPPAAAAALARARARARRP